MRDVASSGRLAAWCGAAVGGGVDPAAAAAAVAGPRDAAHRVLGLPGTDDVTLEESVGVLRALGATALRLVLPVAGDPAGLPGPSGFNLAALDAGAAVLAAGADVALLPAGRGGWQAYPVHHDPRTPLSLREAERGLMAAVRDAADAITRLDVARWEPAAADLRGEVHDAGWTLPPGVDPAARRLLADALRLSALVDVAGASDGGSRTAGEMAARRHALRDVDVAVRRAVEAACSTVPASGAPQAVRDQRSVR